MFRLGVDVGGTFIKAGVIREDNTIVARVSVPTEADKPYKEVIGNIVRGAELAARQAGRELADFPCVGFGIPGLLNGRTGLVALAPNMGDWHQVPFLEEAQKHLPIPAYVGNDANCAVIGETLAGAARGCQDVLLLTLGTGVGGGVIAGGRMLCGGDGMGMELGHMTLCMNGKPCGCGHRGCIEAYCSVSSLIRDTRRAMEADPSSRMHAFAREAGLVDGRTAFECDKLGDAAAHRVVEAYTDYLSQAIGSLITCFRPQVVLIGGGLSNQGDYLTDRLNRKTPGYVMASDAIGTPPIRRAALGNDAGMIGAAYLDRM